MWGSESDSVGKILFWLNFKWWHEWVPHSGTSRRDRFSLLVEFCQFGVRYAMEATLTLVEKYVFSTHCFLLCVVFRMPDPDWPVREASICLGCSENSEASNKQKLQNISGLVFQRETMHDWIRPLGRQISTAVVLYKSITHMLWRYQDTKNGLKIRYIKLSRIE